MEVKKIEVTWLPTSCESCQFLKQVCNSYGLLDLLRVGYRYTTTCLASGECTHHNICSDYSILKRCCPLVLKVDTIDERVDSACKWLNELKFADKHNQIMRSKLLDLIDELKFGYKWWEQQKHIDEVFNKEEIDETDKL